jgi:hypothetical protein
VTTRKLIVLLIASALTGLVAGAVTALNGDSFSPLDVTVFAVVMFCALTLNELRRRLKRSWERAAGYGLLFAGVVLASGLLRGNNTNWLVIALMGFGGAVVLFGMDVSVNRLRQWAEAQERKNATTRQTDGRP